MNILHVFLDTNILYNDPYFKNQNKTLIDYARQGKIKLMISKVVLSELLILQKIRLKQYIEELKKGYNSLKKITQIELDLNGITRDRYLEDIQGFYQTLSSENIIYIIEPSEGIFSTILDKSLNKEAPFFNNKNEFKDSVIWYNYVEYILKNKLKEFCFITDNKRDFCDKDGTLHSELRSVLDITHYSSVQQFNLDQTLYLDIHPTKNILNLMQSIVEKNAKDYIQELFTSQRDEVNIALDTELLSIDTSFAIRDRYPNTIIGYTEIGEWEISDVTELNTEAIDSLLYIKGTIKMKAKFNLYEYLEPNNELEFFSSVYPVIKFHLSLDLNEEGRIEYLLLDKAEIEKM
jgi:hypothetical protein